MAITFVIIPVVYGICLMECSQKQKVKGIPHKNNIVLFSQVKSLAVI
jgi:hypothetical protein